ncbi:MAG: hypothetical protein ACRDDY_16165 [Clostridium sp.]|uniref:hypothetical protein n=1 Tax=Clostridium sp. TaxID=1506 RepID=UPI003EE5CF5F
MEDRQLIRAIEHFKKMASNSPDDKERESSYELLNYLLELKDLREFKKELINVIFK